MRFFGLMLIAFFFLPGPWEAWGVMEGNPRAALPGKDEGKKQGQEIKKEAAPVNHVRRVTELVHRVEGGVLHTSGGRYPLAGVKVVDFTPDRGPVSVKRVPKKTAEMTFVNHQLKEVIIRQRQ